MGDIMIKDLNGFKKMELLLTINILTKESLEHAKNLIK